MYVIAGFYCPIIDAQLQNIVGGSTHTKEYWECMLLNLPFMISLDIGR